MFMQVIFGLSHDPTCLGRQIDSWMTDLKPGAFGWLGCTGAATDDGRTILIARFDTAEAAAANSGRPEQGEWWKGMEACFDGAPEFRNSSDVTTSLRAGSDDAGFVQITQGKTSERVRVDAIRAQFDRELCQRHPGLIGSVMCWYGDGEFTESAYFTDEAAARAGEREIGERPETAALQDEFRSVVTDLEFYDLRSPLLVSA